MDTAQELALLKRFGWERAPIRDRKARPKMAWKKHEDPGGGGITAWQANVTLEGRVIGYRDGKTFGDRVSRLLDFQDDRQGPVCYSMPAELERKLGLLGDARNRVRIVCLGKVRINKTYGNAGWGFDVYEDTEGVPAGGATPGAADDDRIPF